MGWLIAALVVILVLLLAGLLFAYRSFRVAFRSRGTPEARVQNIYSLPKGAQYEENREYMLSLIAEMDAIPF